MSYALRNGYSVLYSATDGPVGTWMYGPLAPYAYLPATWMKTPSSALMFGGMISYLFYFGPVAFLFYWNSRKKEHSKLLFPLLLSCFLLLSQLYEASESSWNGVHVDPIAFGFLTLAGIVLLGTQGKESYQSLIVSSLLVSLSVWTKQTFFPSLVAFTIFTFLLHGFKRFLIHALIQAGVFATVTALLAYQYSWDALLFNTVYYPASFPWRASLFDSARGYVSTSDLVAVLKSLFSFGYELYALLAPFWAVVLFIFIVFKINEKKQNKLKELAQLNPSFSLFFLLSLFLIPTSILGRVKYGGASNCLNPTLFYTMLSVLLLLHGILSSKENQTKVYALSVQAVLFSALVFGVGVKIPELYTRMQPVVRFLNDGTPQDQAFQLSKRYPNQIYFPWFPLPTLMTEGKFYHYAIGVGDRNMSKYPVEQEHFMSHLPSDLKFVAFFDQDHNIMVRLKDFDEQVKLPDFPLFTVFQKPSGK